MNIQWDPKIGLATITSLGGAVSVLVFMGIIWGSTTTKLDAVIEANKENKTLTTLLQASQNKQDDKIAIQAVSIGSMQSTLNFIVPTIQRIESAIASTGSNTWPPATSGPPIGARTKQ